MSGAMVAAGIGAAGAIGGAMISRKGASGGTSTAERTPWEPAVPWLQNNLVQGQVLQDYYQKNPFNAQQQQAYGNLFGDLDNFRSNIAPWLYDKANGMMNSNYQRQSYARPGMAGYGNSNGGLLQSPVAQATFSMPKAGNYGLLNFAPQTGQPAMQSAPADAQAVAKMVQDELERQRQADAERRMLMLVGPDGGTG